MKNFYKWVEFSKEPCAVWDERDLAVLASSLRIRSVCSSQVEFSHMFIEISLNPIYFADFYQATQKYQRGQTGFGQDLLGRDSRRKCPNY